ncbi:hypothetical protein AOQ84DRAFT_392629 [Glonium stellatum]|uniref:VWFA domain-containing protein n=1 Tax=Glonium stellatum TaxID=574774 RepID=A0A8E2EQ78_9PEZI|nr:hypothetical protein AOQ84DRAFT_392629 [Glonium stellatum]
MLQSGGLVVVPSCQLHPQPLRSVKHRPLRGVTHSRRISTTLSRNQGLDGFLGGQDLSRHAPLSSTLPSTERVPSDIPESDTEASRSEPQRVIKRKPSDLPLKIRKTRGSRSSETDSNTSIPSNSCHNGFINGTTQPGSVEGLQKSYSRNLIPSTPPPSYSRPSFQLGETKSSSTLQTGRENISNFATHHLSPSELTESPLRTTPKRHPSVKRRVFTRMLGGLQPRPKLTSPRRNGQSDGSLFRRLSGKSESNRTMRSKSFRVTTPSSDTLSSSQTASEAPSSPFTSEICLAAPRPLPASPTAEGSLLLKTNRTNPLKPSAAIARTCPTPAPVLNLNLKFLPETEYLEATVEKSFWVAIEVEGSVSSTYSATFDVQSSFGLDVIVVIDNSQNASQECLDNTCRFVLLLANMLSNPEDRLAVFCTSCQHRAQKSSSLTGCQLHPLNAPCLEALKEELQAIKEGPILSPRQGVRLGATVSAAIRVLSEPNTIGSRPLRWKGSTVFVFSANPTTCLDIAPLFPSTHIHLVNPSVIPFPMERGVCQTWNVPFAMSNLYNWTPLNIENYESIPDRLQQVVTHARGRGSTGDISDVSVKVVPCHGCQIEGVLGDSAKRTLKLGQSFSLFVRVRPDMTTNRMSPRPAGDTTPKQNSQIDHAFAELEQLLGEKELSLFTVRVIYKHSLFPSNSVIITEETCKTRILDRTAMWGVPDFKTSNSRNSRARAELHRRLAFFIATHSTPKEALSELDRVFTGPTRHTACPQFVDSVRKELHHQLLVLGHRTVAEPPNPIPGNYQDCFPCLGRFSFEAVEGQFQKVSLGPELSKARSPSGSPATVIHQRITEHTEPEEPTDQATQIWRHMRKDSRVRQKPANSSTESIVRLENADERIRELRKRAIQNKRSVGADTLRSLALAGPAAFEGVNAPWL